MATSCESKRTKAYSEDLRWRMIICQIKCLNKKCQEVAENLNVDASTVYHTVKLFDSTGAVEKSYPSNAGTRKLTDIDRLIILENVIENPGIYLAELKHKLIEETGSEVDVSTICRFLSTSGFTWQKMVITAKQ